VPQQVHLDIRVDDIEQSEALALELGGQAAARRRQ
jgi:hypothetical protein